MQNQIKPTPETLDDFLDLWKLDAREPFLYGPEENETLMLEFDKIKAYRDSAPEPLCKHCKMPEMCCECRNYDREGNEL